VFVGRAGDKDKISLPRWSVFMKCLAGFDSIIGGGGGGIGGCQPNKIKY
jgi:hypothetical protein